MFISNLLRSFIVTANNKSMKESAKQLFITESPLSRRIKILEDKLGCSLFLRGRDGISLTKEGEAIYNAILPYYKDMATLENTYLSKHSTEKTNKHKFNISVEFGTVDLFSESASFFNPDVIETLTFNYFHGDITSKLLTTNTDIILSNNKLLFDDALVTCFTYSGIRINIMKSKTMQSHVVNKLIISGLLSKYLNDIQPNWCEKILAELHLNENIEVVTMHDIANYLSNIESGEAVGITYQVPNTAQLNHSSHVNVIPLMLNNCDIKIDLNIYFLNKNETVIMKDFIELFDSI